MATTASTFPANDGRLVGGGFESPVVPAGQMVVSKVPSGWRTIGGGVRLRSSTSTGETSAAVGSQWIGLNTSEARAIEQTIAVTPGQRYRWSFKHRGKSNRDTVEVIIDGEVQTTVSTAPGTWVTVKGEFTPGPGRTSIVFRLRGTDNEETGNWVDDVRFERL